MLQLGTLAIIPYVGQLILESGVLRAIITVFGQIVSGSLFFYVFQQQTVAASFSSVLAYGGMKYIGTGGWVGWGLGEVGVVVVGGGGWSGALGAKGRSRMSRGGGEHMPREGNEGRWARWARHQAIQRVCVCVSALCVQGR